MKNGWLTIEPFSKKLLRPAGISFTLGGQIQIPQTVELVDFRNESVLDYEEITLNDTDPFILKPQQFVLGHTEEIVSVSDKLGFIIEGRSTLARLGVSVEQSATLVDPGHHRRPITLEIFNCGPSPVTLYKGMSIAKAAVFYLSSQSGRSFDEYARYASQKKGVGKPILREKSQ